MTWIRPREVTLIRHGESLRNVVMGEDTYILPDEKSRQRISRHYDHTIPLTLHGHKQAEESGPSIIKDIGLPDCIYHSGYIRAEQTLEGLLKHLSHKAREKIRIYLKHELRERDPGYCWHMIKKEVDEYFPWLAGYHRKAGKFLYRPPGGESIADLVCNRIHSVFGTIIRDRPGEKVWLVCHGHVLRAAVILFERLSLQQINELLTIPVPNLSLVRYTYVEDSETPTRTHFYRYYTGA